jgi:hypothetical protein
MFAFALFHVLYLDMILEWVSGYCMNRKGWWGGGKFCCLYVTIVVSDWENR